MKLSFYVNRWYVSKTLLWLDYALLLPFSIRKFRKKDKQVGPIFPFQPLTCSFPWCPRGPLCRTSIDGDSVFLLRLSEWEKKRAVGKRCFFSNGSHWRETFWMANFWWISKQTFESTRNHEELDIQRTPFKGQRVNSCVFWHRKIQTILWQAIKTAKKMAWKENHGSRKGKTWSFSYMKLKENIASQLINFQRCYVLEILWCLFLQTEIDLCHMTILCFEVVLLAAGKYDIFFDVVAVESQSLVYQQTRPVRIWVIPCQSHFFGNWEFGIHRLTFFFTFRVFHFGWSQAIQKSQQNPFWQLR